MHCSATNTGVLIKRRSLHQSVGRRYAGRRVSESPTAVEVFSDMMHTEQPVDVEFVAR